MEGHRTRRPAPFNLRLLRVESLEDARRILEELGADRGGVAIMSRKALHAVISVENVQARAGHIIKQIMLSKGGECATPRDIFLKRDGREPVRVIMMGTVAQLREAARSLSGQPFRLKSLSAELKKLMDCEFPRERKTRVMEAGPYRLEFGGRTLIMGVVNVTPDSFSDGGRFYRMEDAISGAGEMVEAGADVIDIGGESTRPGSDQVSPEEESRRIIPLVESISGEMGVPISIDTYKAEVAARALDAGAHMVNDISGLRFDPQMIPLVAERGVPVVIMHMQGTPKDMQENPVYEDVVADISRFLRQRAERALEAGVDRGKIIVDPGIGFGKNLYHNLEIMRRVEEFRSLGYPVMVGTSRKSFIGAVLGAPVNKRVLGTAASVAFAIARGVDMVRVHDVAEMKQVVDMADAMAGKTLPGEQP